MARHSVVGADELEFQIEGLSGPERELPDKRMHELFEERAERHPDAIAARCRGDAWTYAQLNENANRIAHSLIENGVTTETVVAVVTERNLGWMASVLGVFKAGGVYLPIEPHFPPGRIERTLARAGCTLIVTERGSTETLTEALSSLPPSRQLYVEDMLASSAAVTNPNIAVGLHQLAYIYFTSGSTGEPKGAMCEHAGMINHLYAKIDDFGIGEGEIVAQIAPQCFDISLWQLVSSLLVGGSTLIVDQDTIMQPDRFAELIVEAKVGVMQVVPSYLEVLLTYLEQHPVE
ncbi:MAG: AMP-binding protein, partial [Acidimicrobiales bacterium]|nr:AMP-binding protein [Acidimicrobiales bacterium]